MTTALLWWMAVLALTWGLVVTVRARGWSPDQADPSELRNRDRGARLALVPVVVLLALVTLVPLSFLGWTAAPSGSGRVLEALPILAVSGTSGIGLIACLLTMAGRRVRSWWLLAGLLPAAAGAATLLGG